MTTDKTKAELAIKGEKQAAAIAAALVRQCVWFELMPWPDDEWVFTVKSEAVPVVEAATMKVEGAV